MAINKDEKYITFETLQRHAKNTIKKTREHDAGVVGGYNGCFPLTTATKGNIYLLPSTQKYYVCITDYNGSQLTVPNANFEELSVYANRSKLDNLIKYKDITIPYSAATYISTNAILDGRKFVEYFGFNVSEYISNGQIIACTPLESPGYMETAEIVNNKAISCSQFIHQDKLNDTSGYIKVRVLYVI